MTDIVIVAAARTAIGAFQGAFAQLSAAELGSVAIRAVLEKAQVAPAEVSEIVMGQVLTAGAGMNPARQAAIGAGLPVEVPAYGVNQVCGSGLRAVALGAQNIATGDADVVVAGGQESMSQSPHCAPLRASRKMADIDLIDTMIRDGCGPLSTATTWVARPRTLLSTGRSTAPSRMRSPAVRRSAPPRPAPPGASSAR